MKTLFGWEFDMKKKCLQLLPIVFLSLIPLLLNSRLYGGHAVLARWDNEILLKPEKIMASDELIFILDRGDETIKVFSTTGVLKKTIGGKGEGPGEFLSAISFSLNQDHVFVLDSMSERIHVFSRNGLQYIESRRFKGYFDSGSSYDIALAGSGECFIARNSGIKGDKLVTRLDKSLSPMISFLDCLPAYENIKDFENQPNPSEVQAKDFWNQGILAISQHHVCFVFNVANTFLQFNYNGKAAVTCELPEKSIQHSAKVKIFGNGVALLDRLLIYDLKIHQNTPVVLLRNPQGKSVLYAIHNNKPSRMAEFNEKLTRFALTGKKIFALEEDEGRVIVYQQ